MLSINRTCKKLNIDHTHVLWKNFEFNDTLKLSKKDIEYILKHSIQFENLNLACTTFTCYFGEIDYAFPRRLNGTHLILLNLSETRISTLCFLLESPNIEILDLSGCKNLIDEDFLIIRKCQKVEQLYLSFTHVSTESLKAITYSLTLFTLDVCGIKFSLADCDAILRHSYKSLLFFYSSVLDTEEREAFETEIIDHYIDCSITIF